MTAPSTKLDGWTVTSDELNLMHAAFDGLAYEPEHRAYVMLSAVIGLMKMLGHDRTVLLDAVRKNWSAIPAPEFIQEN